MRLSLKLFLSVFLIPSLSIAQEGGQYQKVNIQLSSADPERAGASIIAHCPELQQPEMNLKLVNSIESQAAFHYTWEQTFQLLPIVDCGVKATISKSFRIMSLMNSLKNPAGNFAGVFGISLEQAHSNVRNLEGAGVREYKQEVEAAWKQSAEGLNSIYRARIFGIGKSFEIWYDANTFAEIHRIDRIANYKPGGTDSTGTGTVFIPDPLTSAHQNWGGIYVSSGDMDATWLTAELFPVNLLQIQYLAPDFSLEGPYVKCEDIGLPAIAPPMNQTGDFSCTRSHNDFEYVMCYYHIDRFQRYIQSLGFTNLQNNPIRVDAHALNGADNSHFVPNGTDSYLEFGDGCVEDAEDADVIVHEYGHALSYAASPNSNAGNERNGLDEGIGDYFAASYSRSIDSFRWADMFTWDGHNTCWAGRETDSPMLYPPAGFDFYNYGVIWASTMMQVWGAIGQQEADKLVIQELYSNTSNMNLNDAAHLVLDADTLLYNGIHTNDLVTFFCLRGIFTGNECILAIDPSKVDHNKWKLFPNPASQSVRIQVESMKANASYSISDLSGRVILSGILEAGNENSIQVDALAAGTYFFSLFENGANAGVEKLVIQ